MGPRFNGVEDPSLPPDVTFLTTPSMGPRFNGVEDDVAGDAHGCLNAGLQWGHALMAWKTVHSAPKRSLIITPSMGPRFNGVEDSPRLARTRRGRQPSMGPRFNGVEDKTLMLDLAHTLSSFNGATL